MNVESGEVDFRAYSIWEKAPGVLHRSLKNNVSINLNINVDDKFSFQR